MKMVSVEYAFGYIYENDSNDIIKFLKNGNIAYAEDDHTYKAKFNIEKDVIEPVKNNDVYTKDNLIYTKRLINEQSIDIGSVYAIEYISFKVDGDREMKIYKREFSPNNLIYVNDNCECGSCPLLFAENQHGQWRRLKEIISEYRDKKNEGRFEYLLPLSAKSIKIKEMKGENSYFRDMAVLVTTRNNKETAHYMDN